MRPVLPALVLSILAFAAPAQASVPTNEPLTCFSSTAGKFALEGYLQLRAEPGGPAGYRFDAQFPEQKLAGDWSGDGDAGNVFVDGPLAGGRIADAPAGTTMPRDQVEGRTWPLLLTTASGATWYCHSNIVNPRFLLRGEVPWVEQRTGLQVHLPTRFDQGSLNETLDGEPFSSVVARVRVAKKNLWRLELSAGPCSGSDCSSLIIFSAKRASIKQLGHRTPVRLRDGSRGWVGSYGCAFNGTDPDWGPVFCGREAIVWHARGVNYCIESVSLGDKALITLANQTRREPLTVGDLRRR